MLVTDQVKIMIFFSQISKLGVTPCYFMVISKLTVSTVKLPYLLKSKHACF